MLWRILVHVPSAVVHIGIETKDAFLLKKITKDHPGRNIRSWQKNVLYEVIWKADMYTNDDKVEKEDSKVKNSLIDSIHAQTSYSSLYGNNLENLKKMSVNKLMELKKLASLSQNDLADFIKKWFYNHNLVKQE